MMYLLLCQFLEGEIVELKVEAEEQQRFMGSITTSKQGDNIRSQLWQSHQFASSDAACDSSASI